jgi:hypothetical protein
VASKTVLEWNRPDPVVGFLQANVLIDHRVGEVQQAVLETKGAAGRDLLDDEIPRILGDGKALRIGPWRCPVLRSWCLLSQPLVWPFRVVLP